MYNVAAAPEPVVTWEEAKAHLRLDVDTEKALVERLVSAATYWLDGPTGRLGRALGVQKLELRVDAFDCIPALFGPVIEVDEIGYIDTNGVSQIVPGDVYEIRDGQLVLAWGKSWPVARDHGDAIRILYWAGYGSRDTDDPEKWINAVPPPIKVAILLYVGAWYENREETAIGVSVAGLPHNVSAESLLQTYKVYR